VSAVVEQDGKFLIVEERSSGVVVLNQPGGHIESGEAPEQAVVREALEEAGCQIEVAELLGVYLWIHDLRHRQKDLRTPVVSRCVEDYLTGDRQSDTFLTEIMPVQQNVGLVLANARLI